MIDFKLDETGDVAFDEDLVEVSDVDEVKQAVMVLLKTRLGEFFADQAMGLDTDYVLTKNYNEAYATSAITDAIQKDARVTAVSNISLSIQPNRVLLAEVEFIVGNQVQSNEVMISA